MYSTGVDLELWVGVQHDVLYGSLDILRPAGQPCDRVVMTNLLPAVTRGRSRDLRLTGER